MTARRVRDVSLDRDGPPFTLKDAEMNLGDTERRRDEMQREVSTEIAEMHAYVLRNQNHALFTVDERARVAKAIFQAEKLWQSLEDIYTEKILRQRRLVQRRQSSLVAFGMLGLTGHALHAMNWPHELMDVILRLASA
jgi:hypothetical protein